MKIEDKILLFLEYLTYTIAIITIPFIGIINSKGTTIKSGILVFTIVLLVLCGIDAKITRNNKSIKNYKKIEIMKLLNLKAIR